MSAVLRKLIKLPEVITLTGKSRAAIYADINKNVFPAPIKIGERSVAWTESSIAEWQESCINKSRIPK
jgi:prophage regulatory protein